MLESKKQNLIEILQKLSWKWDKAEWLIVLIKNTNDEKLMDTVIESIKNGMDIIRDKKVKEKMSDTVDFLEKLKEEEKMEYEKGLLEAKEMLKGIE